MMTMSPMMRSPVNVSLFTSIELWNGHGGVCFVIQQFRTSTHLHSVRTRELPDNYPYAIRMWYIKEFIKQWEDPANVYFAEVCRIVQTFTKELVREHFGRFSDSGLHGHVQYVLIRACSTAYLSSCWILGFSSRMN